MATIRKLKSGNKSWQVMIRRQGQKAISKTFFNKKDALRWANLKEAEISQGIFTDFSQAESYSFIDVVDRYWKEIGQFKKSGKRLFSQINILKNSEVFSDLNLAKVTPEVITKYKNYRIESGVSSATVRKDLSFIHRLFVVVEKEWHVMLPKGNPARFVSRPEDHQVTERTRRLEGDELSILLEALKNSPQVRAFVEFAIETGMRRSEITEICIKNVNFEKSTLFIPSAKNNHPRTIPLSPKAVKILKKMEEFNLKPDSVTQAFSRACLRVGIKGLRLHDLRHEATSRFFEKGLNPIQVAAITGHKDFRMLNRYTHLRAEELVKLL
ncbi:MAG: tyrosine-type recombinase/integrase [Bacteriovoracaceae bacterium]|nr:tyrosine-type recombinase/integrase [Bacteriovoracaceae bacterium]